MYDLPSEHSMNYPSCTSVLIGSEKNNNFNNTTTNSRQEDQEHHNDVRERLAKKKTNRASSRIFFFIIVFCLSGLIVYIALSRVYGFGSSSNDLAAVDLFKRFNESSDEKFLLIVFAWKRRASLERLVDSLKRADYLGMQVNVQFHVEFDPSQEVREYLNELQWTQGEKSIIWRKERFGLERMVIESWEAKDDNEFAFFFEDDIEVHPQYFKFALEAMNLSNYSTNNNNNNSILDPQSSVIGISLSTPRFDEVNLERSVWSPEFIIGGESHLFLFQQPCSWGALYFPWAWRRFLEYHLKRRGKGPFHEEFLKVIPESCVSDWKRSWKKYLMELMVIEGSVMLYPSLPRQQSLSLHHREQGEHTGWGAQRQRVLSVNEKVVDYFCVPLAEDAAIKTLFSALSNDGDKSLLPIVSFHQFKVDSIEDLKRFGKLIEAHVHD